MIGAGVAVPGLVLDRRLGTGEHGEVWRALDLVPGDDGAARAVAVQVGRPAAGPGAVAREAALLRRIDHENVVRLRSVLDLRDGRRAVVLDLVPGDDLATLVDRRGPLPAGEVGTVAIALARALEHVHGLGLVHGRISPHDVLFAADGRPVLAGVGIPSLLARTTTNGPPIYPTAADDVRGLGEVLRHALTGGAHEATVTGPLAPVVAACLAGDPGSRPPPSRVATLAWDAGPALPVDVGERGSAASRPPPAVHDGHRDEPEAVHRSFRRPLLAVVVGLAAVALTVAALVLAVRVRHDPPPPIVGAAVGGLEDPRGVVSASAGWASRSPTRACSRSAAGRPSSAREWRRRPTSGSARTAPSASGYRRGRRGACASRWSGRRPAGASPRRVEPQSPAISQRAATSSVGWRKA